MNAWRASRSWCPGRWVAGLLLLWTASAAADDELYFGSVAMDIPAEMHRRLKPLTDYLTRELGRPVRLRLSPDLASAAHELATGRVDMAYLTPVAYVRAHRAGGARLVVKTVTASQGSFRLMIVVRADGRVRTLEDLRGTNFAFGDPAALLQRAVVAQAGVALDALHTHTFVGHYDNIVRGVLNGDFDGGIVKDTTAWEWQDRGLRVLHVSPALPPYNIAASARIDGALVAEIRRAFLRLDRRNPAHRAIIDALDPSYNGFAAVADAEYDVVRGLIRPFEDRP